MRAAFTEIYDRNVWGSGSGHGSAARFTSPYRALVERLVYENKIGTIVDFGCGDWQFSHRIDWNGAKYLGLDIVTSVVEANRRRFATNNVSFEVAGESFADLPVADLLLVKDVLQHWSTTDVMRFVSEALPKYRTALITNCVEPRHRVNAEIDTGDFRPLDLRLQPYNLTAECVLTFEGPSTFSWRKLRHYPAWRKHVLLLRGADTAAGNGHVTGGERSPG
jgi:SAM-dependent methyltransferase